MTNLDHTNSLNKLQVELLIKKTPKTYLQDTPIGKAQIIRINKNNVLLFVTPSNSGNWAVVGNVHCSVSLTFNHDFILGWVITKSDIARVDTTDYKKPSAFAIDQIHKVATKAVTNWAAEHNPRNALVPLEQEKLELLNKVKDIDRRLDSLKSYLIKIGRIEA